MNAQILPPVYPAEMPPIYFTAHFEGTFGFSEPEAAAMFLKSVYKAAWELYRATGSDVEAFQGSDFSEATVQVWSDCAHLASTPLLLNSRD